MEKRKKSKRGEMETLRQVLLCIRDDLSDIRNSIQLHKPILTLDEFCLYAGISKSYAYHLTSSQAIRHYKPKNKLIYIDKEDAEEFMRSNVVKSIGSINADSTRFIINSKK